ncbi:hypothetical protein ISCGN_002386 [Ixodes scapularis]
MARAAVDPLAKECAGALHRERNRRPPRSRLKPWQWPLGPHPPPQGQQLSPPSGGSTSAAPKSQDRQAMPMPVLTAKPSPGGKERHPRSNSLERASSKEQHNSRAALPVLKGPEQAELKDSAQHLRCLFGWSRPGPDPPDPSRKTTLANTSDTTQEADLSMELDDSAAPASDPDSMEWQTQTRAGKNKKPVTAPK